MGPKRVGGLVRIPARMGSASAVPPVVLDLWAGGRAQLCADGPGVLTTPVL
jgi:hypothetical protein